MLKLTNIVKEYPTGDSKVVALKGVDIEFRKSEFVSILGHSGCGKTTLLNIIGGLDQYTDGDLIIKNRSTKDFKDRDWDTYRNHSVGFVFQNYNLIPHQTVLSNVELALTLSGVSKAERKKRAKEALEKVGLGDQLNKKPNQMSGGQMQRVAIARALVNNPEILLADEPTGALDTETSVQIMDILKEISADRLVIMVTHNPELAEEYSTRIIRLVDGSIVDDSAPYDSSAETVEEIKDEKKPSKKEAKKARKKTSMSFFTALSLSLNNLMTKKMRTFLTSFAGSIGIIGIALILSLSHGFTLYIESIQKEALTSYPIMIESSTMDMNAMMSGMTGSSTGEVNHGLDKVYSNTMMASMMESFTKGIKYNDLASFKKYLESDNSKIKEYSSSIQYTYGGKLNIYSADMSNGINQVYPSPVVGMANSMMGAGMGGMMVDNATMETYSNKFLNSWMELIDNDSLLEEQYDIVTGSWPNNYNEVILIVDKNNEISDIAIQGLGLSTMEDMMEGFMAMTQGQEYVAKTYEFEFSEIIGREFKIVLEPDYYAYDDATNTYIDKHGDEEYIKTLIENGESIKVVGIVRPAEGSLMVATTGSIGYTAALTEHVINKTNEAEIVKQQKANPEIDVFTGLPFEKTEDVAPEADAPAVEQAAPAASDVSLDPQIDPAIAPVSDVQASAMVAGGKAPLATPTASLSAEDIYAMIDENYEGQQREDIIRMVDLFLQSSRTKEEKEELATLLGPTLNIPGIGEMSSEQAVNMMGTLGKNAKLEILTGMVNGEYGDVLPPPNKTETPENPDVPVDPENPDAPVTPEVPVEPEVPEEPEPETFAASYEQALSILGVADINKPTSISIYPLDFEAKDIISAEIENYNQMVKNGEIAPPEGADENYDGTIQYTDYIGLLLSSVTKIVNVISYVLMAFVAISLIVSSLMIGIITYISVLERTKEIGILRAIGASKRDISSVFNAETLIVGFVSGIIGIGTTLLLTIPINALIKHFTSIPNVAQLPALPAVILVIISMSLTFIAGLIPAKIASKKDPVEALRSE